MRRLVVQLAVIALAIAFVPSAVANDGRWSSRDEPALLPWATSLAAIGAFLTAAAIPLTAFYRRPSLTLHEDDQRVHSLVEGDGLPYLRLVVKNRRGRRAARAARVFVVHYREQGPADSVTTMGSPDLGWTSLFNAHGVVLPGGERPIDFGVLFPAYRNNYGQVVSNYPDEDPAMIVSKGREWQFKLSLANGLALANQREYLAPKPNGYVVRLDLGAEEGPARSYDVYVNWNGTAKDEQAALTSVQVQVPKQRGRR